MIAGSEATREVGRVIRPQSFTGLCRGMTETGFFDEGQDGCFIQLRNTVVTQRRELI